MAMPRHFPDAVPAEHREADARIDRAASLLAAALLGDLPHDVAELGALAHLEQARRHLEIAWRSEQLRRSA